MVALRGYGSPLMEISLYIINTLVKPPKRELKQIFRRGSKNFYASSFLFPLKVHRDITILYAFVRTVDNYVDCIPQKPAELNQFRQAYQQARQNCTSTNPVVSAFVKLMQRCNFEADWIEAFFESMYMDLHKKRHNSLEETLKYTYGSAEVIGLCIIRILRAPRQLEHQACLYGRALQYINFIRDIKEDNQLDRIYLPVAEYNLPDLSQESAMRYPQRFRAFMAKQLEYYHSWFRQGAEGLSQLAYRYRLAIGTAGRLYNWVAVRIARDPFVIYRYKVHPSRITIIRLALLYSIRALFE